MNTYEEIEQYLSFLNQYNLMYKDYDILQPVTDPDELIEYSRIHGKKLGIIYRSDYNIFAVDLVRNSKGELFTYERIVKAAKGNSVVIIAKYNNSFVLINQFRHALGTYQIAFPRGYGEPDISVEANAAKEIQEELNADAYDIKLLGAVVADSGICGEKVNVVLCSVNAPLTDGVYEGIKNILLFSESELREAISKGMINDGFTLAAYSLYKESNHSQADTTH